MKKEKKEEFFNKYKGYVIKTASTLWDGWEFKNKPCFNYLSKEDIIQEALIKLLSLIDKIDTTKSNEQIILFINQSTKHHVLNEFRKLSRLKKMGPIEHAEVETLLAREEYDDSYQKQVVLEFFDQLNTNDKKYISLVLNGATRKEAQNRLNWTDKTLEDKQKHFDIILKGILNGTETK